MAIDARKERLRSIESEPVKRTTYFGQTCSEQNTLVKFTDALQELVHVRPLQDVDRMNFALYVYGHDEIGIIGRLAKERRMLGYIDKLSLVQIRI